MSEPATIRDGIKELRRLHAQIGNKCVWCETAWPCGHLIVLDDMLRLLDNGDFDIHAGTTTIPDPLGVS